MSDSAFDSWKDRAADTPIASVAGRLGVKLRKVTATEWVGPCPRPGCGGKDRFSINTIKNVFHCRRCGEGGHGGIDLVIFAKGVEFLAACEIITGEAPPDRASRLAPEDKDRIAREAAAREAAEAKRQADADAFRERERGALYDVWNAAARDTDELHAYLRRRLGADVPPLARLRLVRGMPYYAQGADRGEVLAHAPAMLAPIVDAGGIFRGLHFTYLDPAAPNGKLRIADPSTGEDLPAKKVRGSKKANRIELIRPDAAPRQLIIGEGIEKVLAVWLALTLAGRDLAATAFWTSVDLGNLGGPHAASWAHPSLTTAAGRPQRVAGPVPDLDKPAIEIPDSVEDLVLLGDSTSDDFTTRCALARATARYAREGRTVRTAWAPAGQDFDDVLREAA